MLEPMMLEPTTLLPSAAQVARAARGRSADRRCAHHGRAAPKQQQTTTPTMMEAAHRNSVQARMSKKMAAVAAKLESTLRSKSRIAAPAFFVFNKKRSCAVNAGGTTLRWYRDLVAVSHSPDWECTW